MADEFEASAAARDVIAERHRQISEEDWSLAHDDAHRAGEMAAAAACYCVHSVVQASLESKGYDHDQIAAASSAAPLPKSWPWVPTWWKPKDSRRNLVRAAALIIAEIERIDRAAAKRVAA